ncbi:MAG: VOC family protein [Patescibacteria group bacterium]|nr:VOC family protein [Patescibacteria group bacterium]MDE2172689.1 VOC family protein [Patescibacteria group bacterium]
MKNHPEKITPFIWFEKGAEDAAKFYVDVFNGRPGTSNTSRITSGMNHDENSSKASGMPNGSVLTVGIELDGVPFTFLNGGPQDWAKPSGRVSFVIHCADQAEVDYFWQKLGEEGGEPGQCGWINRDKYGITWQVVPSAMFKYIGGSDSEAASRAMQAMMEMTKIDIGKIRKAYEGK